jgi:hypothetical protein
MILIKILSIYYEIVKKYLTPICNNMLYYLYLHLFTNYALFITTET